MLDLFRTSGFKSDFKKLTNEDRDRLKAILIRLIASKILEDKYRNHPLIGNYKGCFECHLKPDLLLIYKIDNDDNELQLVRIGSHSELFKK